MITVKQKLQDQQGFKKKLEAIKKNILYKQIAFARQISVDMTENIKQNLPNGNLQKSIESEVEISNQETNINIKTGDLKGKAPYAKFLEYGTSKMKARPFLTPALAKYSKLLAEKIRNIKCV